MVGFLPGITFSQTSQVRLSTFSGGFAVPQSSTTRAQSMVAQSFVGVSANATTRILSGFLPAVDGILDVGGTSGGAIPLVYALGQNYPNPFNPATRIQFSVPGTAHVSLKVFDVLGREIVSLFDGEKSAGKYSVDFNASNLASGVYFYRIQAIGTDKSSYVDTKRLILVK